MRGWPIPIDKKTTDLAVTVDSLMGNKKYACESLLYSYSCFDERLLVTLISNDNEVTG